MSSWFGSKTASKSSAPTVAGTGAAAAAAGGSMQEWPCSCEHCFSMISKLAPPPLTQATQAKESAGKSEKEGKEGKEGKAPKPTWQAAVKLLGQSPGAHYVRYPFLEQYAENVFKFDKHQILRIRVQDLRMHLQKMRVIIPELLDYPLAEYEGPRDPPTSILPGPASTSATSSATSSAPSAGSSLDVDALVTKLAHALRQHKKERKRLKGRHRHGRGSRNENEDKELQEREEEEEEEEGEEEERQQEVRGGQKYEEEGGQEEEEDDEEEEPELELEEVGAPRRGRRSRAATARGGRRRH